MGADCRCRWACPLTLSQAPPPAPPNTVTSGLKTRWRRTRCETEAHKPTGDVPVVRYFTDTSPHIDFQQFKLFVRVIPNLSTSFWWPHISLDWLSSTFTAVITHDKTKTCHKPRREKRAPWKFFNYLLQKFPSSEYPEWQSGSDSTVARRGQMERGRGGGGCVKHKKKEVKYGRRLFCLSAARSGGQGGEPAAGALNDLVLVERRLMRHLRSPRLLVLFFLFQN